MTHPIVALQAALLASWREDEALVALIGADGVFDAPPKGRSPPYAVIARHDLLPRDGDLAPGWEHRLLVHVWAGAPSRRAAVAIAGRIAAAATAVNGGGGLVVTSALHERTDTAMDPATGQGRAAVTLRFYTEAE